MVKGAVQDAGDRGAVHGLDSNTEFVALSWCESWDFDRDASGIGAEAGSGDFEGVFVVMLRSVIGAAFKVPDLEGERIGGDAGWGDGIAEGHGERSAGSVESNG